MRLTLREVDGLHYIAFQEDFYHPDVCNIWAPCQGSDCIDIRFQDLMSLLVPPLVPFIRLFLASATWVSDVSAAVANTLGITGMGSSSSPPPATGEGDTYESDGGLYDSSKRKVD